MAAVPSGPLVIGESFENSKTVATTLRSDLRFKGDQLTDEPLTPGVRFTP